MNKLNTFQTVMTQIVVCITAGAIFGCKIVGGTLYQHDVLIPVLPPGPQSNGLVKQPNIKGLHVLPSIGIVEGFPRGGAAADGAGGGSRENEPIEEDLRQEEETDTTSSSSSSTVSRKMYNKQATNWVRTEPRCLSDFTGRPVVFDMISSEIQKLQKVQVSGSASTSKKTILDVGCGEGYCARKVIELGAAKVIGSDISQEMVNSAIATSDGDNRFKFYSAPCGELLNGMNQRCSFLGIDKAEESVDVAIAVFLFNYLTTMEMQDAIRQTYEALKPGGAFIFSVPHPSMIFCHDKDAIFRLDSEGKGYFSARNEKIFGQISTIDGGKLNIMSVHKTMNDYIEAINNVGFHIEDIKEVGVTQEHLEMNQDFFESVKDRPLHLIFKLRKP